MYHISTWTQEDSASGVHRRGSYFTGDFEHAGIRTGVCRKLRGRYGNIFQRFLS